MCYDTSKVDLFGEVFLGTEATTCHAQSKETKKADTNNNHKEFFRKSHLI